MSSCEVSLSRIHDQLTRRNDNNLAKLEMENQHSNTFLLDVSIFQAKQVKIFLIKC